MREAKLAAIPRTPLANQSPLDLEPSPLAALANRKTILATKHLNNHAEVSRLKNNSVPVIK